MSQFFISAIIIGAGEGTRFGETKQIYKIKEKTMLKTVVDLVIPYFYETILVLGYKYDEILKTINLQTDLKIVRNENYKKGMSSSLKKGISQISQKTTHFAIFLGDMPYIKKSTIKELLGNIYMANEEIIAPIYNNRRGFPVIFPVNYKNFFEKIEGDKGARDIIKNTKNIYFVEVFDPGIVKDIDTKKDLKKF